MKKIKLISALVFSLIVTGCNIYKNPSEVTALNTKIPFKDASLIQGSATKDGIIAAAEIPDSDMQYKMLSETVSGKYIPILLTITNNSSGNILFLDANLERDGKTLNKIPLIDVVESLQGHFWLTARIFAGGNTGEAMNEKQRRDEAVNVNLYNKSMRETIIMPDHTTQGFYFYKAPEKGKDVKNYRLKLKFQKLTRLKYFYLTVPVLSKR